MKRQGRYQQFSLVTLVQSAYLTAAFFVQNRLQTYASSCAFGFFMSFVPVVMMICTILLRILHTAPDMLAQLFPDMDMFGSLFSVGQVIDALQAVRQTGVFEALIGISIFWMASRFFTSVMSGMSNIFHQYARPLPMIVQLISLAGEVVLVVSLATVTFLITIVRSFWASDILTALLPDFVLELIQKLLYFMPSILLFLFVAVCYRAAARTRPAMPLCLLASFLCTAIFGAVHLVLNLFIDMNKYNLIYGVMSNVIVLLLEVFIFFVLFFFFAQYIFVLQFFDELLLAELYLLPDRDAVDIRSIFRRLLFIRPDRFLEDYDAVFYCPPGAVVFREGDRSADVYYIAAGTVELSRVNCLEFRERGDFFGEMSAHLKTRRRVTARASTAVQLIKIEYARFQRMIESNPEVSRKLLGQVPEFMA